MNNQMQRPYPKFSLGFKQGAAKLVTEKGYAHQQAAGSLGIPLGAIGRWPRAGRRPANISPTKTATLSLAGQAA
jgi:transposase